MTAAIDLLRLASFCGGLHIRLVAGVPIEESKYSELLGSF